MIKIVRIIILLLTTFVASIVLPAMVQKITKAPTNYPHAVYSEKAHKLFYYKYLKAGAQISDRDGKSYTLAEGDSLMPIYNYRQLMQVGRAPDTLNGIEISQREVLNATINIRIESSSVDKPEAKLGMLYESMPKRDGLQLPDDVFRFTADGIEFENVQTHEVNTEKSRKFSDALRKNNVKFPIKSMSGDLSLRKRYDEGYFFIDANGELFHLKMVNGKPFVRNTHAADTVDVARFTMSLPTNRKFYGYVVGADSSLWLLKAGDGSYALRRFDIAPLALGKDNVYINGSLFYWIVTTTTAAGRQVYVLDSETLEQIDHDFLPSPPNDNSLWTERLFFLYTEMSHTDSYFTFPRVAFGGFGALILNAILAAIYLLTRCRKWPIINKLLSILFILITGAAGFAGLMLMPRVHRNKLISNEI